MRSQRSKQRTSRTGDTIAELDLARGSADSRCSRKMLSSTEAIVDDVGEISVDDIPGHPRYGISDSFPEDKNLRSPTFDGDTDEKEIDGLPRMPPQTRAPGTCSRQNFSSPSEVHVHVDYGSSCSRETTKEGVRLGNSIVIGAGGTNSTSASGPDDKKGRLSQWGLGDGAL